MPSAVSQQLAQALLDLRLILGIMLKLTLYLFHDQPKNPAICRHPCVAVWNIWKRISASCVTMSGASFALSITNLKWLLRVCLRWSKLGVNIHMAIYPELSHDNVGG